MGKLIELITGESSTITAAIVIIIILFLAAYIFARRYQKAGPNEVFIISGRKRKFRYANGRDAIHGFRCVRGGGTFVWPVLEKVDVLSLELFTLEIETPEVYTMLGVPVLVDGIAQVKVNGEEESIITAAERFLGKRAEEIQRIALQTLEGHLRAVLGTMTVEDIYKNRETFAQRVQEIATADMANMGLKIDSFTIRNIKDNQGYLNALGQPRIAQVKRDAIIAKAEADRDATIKSTQANQAGQEASFAADTKVAEAKRDYEMKVADYQASVNNRKAESDLAYDLQKYKTAQAVKAEEIQVQVIEKERSIQVQEMEIKRREKELDATIRKPAEAKRYEVEQLAEAERQRLSKTAEGKALADKSVGFADADVVQRTGEAEGSAQKAKGLAQADVIRAKGLAEAEAMRKKAESWTLYNQAAVVQMLIEGLPVLAEKIAAPLSKIDKMTVINMGGEGDTGGGASKITRDVTQIMAQIPPVIQALTGIDLAELIKRMPGIKADWPKPSGDAEKK
ncbi:MAG: SPFH domain-containing protein [Candidatus Sumerlaeota bacterium]|nr:SPFH domain-containing protein [Candidatus Sumerlaeota bacterium]